MNSFISYPAQRNNEQGFTLIELSIVLVIIGLIVGGVLVGQDLIKAAEVRATISQIEKYNTAVNTFRGKFNGLPGDIQAASAASFGLATRGTAGTPSATTGSGDGNGLVEGCAAASATFGCETSLFWADLSTANLIDGSFGTSTNDIEVPQAAATNALVAAQLPNAKLGKGNYIAVWTDGSYNYFYLGGFKSSGIGAATSGTSGGTYNVPADGAGSLTPLQAYSMDAKVDDGAPSTGAVKVVKAAATPISVDGDATTAGYCATGASIAASTYNVGTVYGNSQVCSMQFRFN